MNSRARDLDDLTRELVSENRRVGVFAPAMRMQRVALARRAPRFRRDPRAPPSVAGGRGAGLDRPAPGAPVRRSRPDLHQARPAPRHARGSLPARGHARALVAALGRAADEAARRRAPPAPRAARGLRSRVRVDRPARRWRRRRSGRCIARCCACRTTAIQRVVIKIQRPGLARMVGADLAHHAPLRGPLVAGDPGDRGARPARAPRRVRALDHRASSTSRAKRRTRRACRRCSTARPRCACRAS